MRVHMTREVAVPTNGPMNSQTLHVDPSQIGTTKQAFQDALDRVNGQLRDLRSAHQQPWAGDPVSAETAQAVNQRTFAGDHANAAEQALVGYAQQLSNTINALHQSEQAYRNAEAENSAFWR